MDGLGDRFMRTGKVARIGNGTQIISNDASLAQELRRNKENGNSGNRRFRRKQGTEGRTKKIQNNNQLAESRANDSMWNEIFSSDDRVLYLAAQKIRKTICQSSSPPIHLVFQVRQGVVERLVELLPRYDHPALQFEVCWILTNIAAGNSFHTDKIYQAEAIPALIDILKVREVETEIHEQALWALSNIAGDCVRFRNEVLGYNVMKALENLISDDSPINLKQQTAWALRNFLHGQPRPRDDATIPCISFLQVLLDTQDEVILIHTMLAMSDLCRISSEALYKAVNARLVPRVVELLSDANPNIREAALLTCDAIVTGNEFPAQELVLSNAVEKIKLLLYSKNKLVRSRTCKLISKIATTSVEHIEVILPSVVKRLMEIITQDEIGVSRWAARAVYNLISRGSDEQRMLLLQSRAINTLEQYIRKEKDSRRKSLALEALNHLRQQ